MGIKIAITDDHPLVLEGLRNVLTAREDFEITGAYPDGKSLLAGLQQQLPDVLLLDVYLPDIKGTELIKTISHKYPSLRCIALTSAENLPDINAMIRNGCAGYLLKNASVQLLMEAIQKVFEGEDFLEPEIRARLLQANTHAAPQTSPVPLQLTKRERSILEMIGAGKTSQEIASELFLSYRTIQNNRQSLYKKYGVHNSIELVRVAIQNGDLPG
jgi:DNA-binding NarL/FixJ family response regulator